MAKKLLVKGGCLIDPVRGYDGTVSDILITDGYIEKVETCIEPDSDMQVLTLNGEYVAPGFIDGHVHAYSKIGLGVPADEIGVQTGTTTMIDAGSAGPLNIEDFIESDIKPSKTRIYSAMHYAKTGLASMPEADDESKYDLELVKEAYEKYSDYIVAIKGRASNSCVGQLGIRSIEAGKKAAKELGIPYLVHIGNIPPAIEDVLNLMEKGDIITHAFHGKKNNLFTDGQIKPEAQAARDRKVIFDVGHGEASFNFNVGELAKSLGFYPDMISTDLHARNYKGPVYSLSITMDKMMALGYSLSECVDKVTDKPAAFFGLDKLGKLQAGSLGDLTIFTVEDGEYCFYDADGNILKGQKSIQPKYAVVGGEIVLNTADNEILEKIRQEIDIPESKFERYSKTTKEVLAWLKEKGIEFAEGNKLAFVNHIVTLYMRTETGEKVDDVGEEVFEQLSKEAVDATKELMEMVSSVYGTVDKAEYALVAIHIFTAMEMMKGNM